MRLLFKWLLRAILSIILFVALVWVAQWVISKFSTDYELPDEQSTIQLYLLSNGVHTDIVLPIKNEWIHWDTVFPISNTLDKDSTLSWMAIGWGDKGFYLETPEWKDLKLSVALNAMLGLGNSALHVTYHDAIILNEKSRTFHLNASQYQQLIAYIQSYIYRQHSGQSEYIPTNAQYGGNDAFYESIGSYSMFYTCNTWTNNALKAAKAKACVWTLFDQPILDKYPMQ